MNSSPSVVSVTQAFAFPGSVGSNFEASGLPAEGLRPKDLKFVRDVGNSMSEGFFRTLAVLL